MSALGAGIAPEDLPLAAQQAAHLCAAAIEAAFGRANRPVDMLVAVIADSGVVFAATPLTASELGTIVTAIAGGVAKTPRPSHCAGCAAAYDALVMTRGLLTQEPHRC